MVCYVSDGSVPERSKNIRYPCDTEKGTPACKIFPYDYSRKKSKVFGFRKKKLGFFKVKNAGETHNPKQIHFYLSFDIIFLQKGYHWITTFNT